MSESNSRSWKGPFLEAMFETDKERLRKLVYAAEGAMFLRSQELAGRTTTKNAANCKWLARLY